MLLYVLIFGYTTSIIFIKRKLKALETYLKLFFMSIGGSWHSLVPGPKKLICILFSISLFCQYIYFYLNYFRSIIFFLSTFFVL